MEIKQISSADIADFNSILPYLIKSTIRLPDDALRYFANQWSEEKLRSCMDSWVFLIAKDKEEIGGLVVATPIEGGVGTIIWLLVDKNLQKKGLGALLFSKACDIYRSKGAHKIKLTVPDEETTLFYIKQGMILEGVHRKHWWGSDFWAMGIQL